MGNETFFGNVIPTYNTNPDHLISCIQSIVKQTYSNWEICIVDDASTSEETKHALLKVERLISPDQLKIRYKQINGHICTASNEAIDMASGDFLVFVDHDDVLDDDALLDCKMYKRESGSESCLHRRRQAEIRQTNYIVHTLSIV